MGYSTGSGAIGFNTAAPEKYRTLPVTTVLSLLSATTAEASITDVERWLAEAQADVLIVGHTHQPFTLATASGGLIANPGALLHSGCEWSHLGLVYDLERQTYVLGSITPGGTFGILELPARAFKFSRAADGVEIGIPRLTVGVTDKRSC